MLSLVNIKVNNLRKKPCMKSTCWDTRATDSIIKDVQKDTETSPDKSSDCG